MVAVVTSGNLPSRAEFHSVIDAKSDRWYAACLRITGNSALAEDAVQDALLSAWNKRSQFQQNARLDTWIHRIAVNAALQLVRKQKPGRFSSLDTEVEDDSMSPERAQHEQELHSELEDAMQGLTEIERMCFVLKHLEQWRLNEIAEELDVKIDTVKQALFRALKKMRVTMASLQGEAI